MAKRLNLALQGGGSHGAFTWGVLDRLLEEDDIEFAAISGTSAGAMNAVAFADGWVTGGREGAQAKLASFWRAVGRKGRFSPVQRTPWDMLWGSWSVEKAPGFLWFEAMSRTFSPYMANPLNINPLREVVEEEIDFDKVRGCATLKVFVSATNVETGQPRVFETQEISRDVVMASACLPQLFHAVEIDGVPYWDGGYGGNPPLYPFFYASDTEDVLLVQINPVERAGVPRSAREIQNRVDEITYNAGLLREFRAIAFVKELIEAGRIDEGQYRNIRMHRIDADDALANLSASSKLSAEPAFLDYLHDLGHAAAEDWIADNLASVGKDATLDLSDMVAAGMRPKRGLGQRMRAFLSERPVPKAMAG
jgi:NTE family protein